MAASPREIAVLFSGVFFLDYISLRPGVGHGSLLITGPIYFSVIATTEKERGGGTLSWHPLLRQIYISL